MDAGLVVAVRSERDLQPVVVAIVHNLDCGLEAARRHVVEFDPKSDRETAGHSRHLRIRAVEHQLACGGNLAVELPNTGGMQTAGVD